MFLEELKKYNPEVLNAVQNSVMHAKRDSDFIRLDAAAFQMSPQISVDYAVLEKTKLAAVFPVDYHWNDIGSFDALHSILPKDQDGNAVVGHGVVLDGRDNLIVAAQQLTTIVGLDDVMVIATDDAILVTTKTQSAKLKTLTSLLEKNGYGEAK